MIQTLGDEECHFILAFDNGYFSENATFSASTRSTISLPRSRSAAGG